MLFFNNIIYPLLFPIRIFGFVLIALVSLCLPKFLYEYIFKNANLLLLLSVGIYPNKIIDLRKNKVNTKIIIFQHRCFVDCFIINYIFGPVGYVFRNIFKNNYIINSYIRKYGGVDVSSEGNEGKTKLIIEYVKNNKRKLAIAPEDITNYKTRIVANNNLGEFKSGAFVPEVPIQPVVIKFYNKDVIWKNLDNGFEEMVPWYIKQFMRPISFIDIYLLEECSSADCMSVLEYKEDVRNKMLGAIIKF
jgi:hypothetical protein